MEARHEIIPFDQASPIRLFMHKLGDVSRHWHESLELLFVLAGEVTVLTGDRQTLLQTDDMLLVNSNVIHELHSESCVLIAVQIKLSKFDLSESLLDQLYFDCDSTSDPQPLHFVKLKQIITSMLQIDMAGDSTALFRARALAYDLLGELAQNFKVDKPVAEMNTHKHLERLNHILRYISDHYQEQLTLGQLAEREHLSTPYLSSFFEKYMGINFSTYYTNLRLERAIHDLLYTDIPVEQVALKNGFSDPRAYVRAFKKRYNTIPSVYRKTAAAPAARTDADPLLAINYLDFKPENYFHILSQYLPGSENAPTQPPVHESGSLLSLCADVSAEGRQLQHHWKNFIGIERAKDLLYADVQDMLRQLQRDVGFKHLRFHGIFSDDMLVCQRTKDGRLEFNFSIVDKVLDFVISVGLKPMIQFSFMPAALAEDPEHRVFLNPAVISMPKHMEEWNHLVRQFLAHIRARYGQREIRSWLYSVWNEPDTSREMFGFARREDYFSLYENTYRTVKDFDASLVFGSPSLFPATEDGYQWLRDYFGFTRGKGCEPEFIDVHYYSDDFENLPHHAATFSAPARFNRDPEHFSHFLDRLLSFTAEEKLSSVPLYITEWNLTVSHRNLINDTCFKACHLAKNFLENYDRVGAFGYWALTDFMDELFPSETLFHGGMGLFTASGIKKPSYHAMSMMAKLGDELIGSGEGYFITRQSGGGIAAMLYNYEHCNPLLVDEGLGLSPTSRDGVFPNRSKLDIALSLEKLPAEAYRIRETILNQSHGSCFDAWVDMGAEDLGADEAEWLRRSCVPELRLSRADAPEASLHYNATLATHEVRLVEFMPIEEGYF